MPNCHECQVETPQPLCLECCHEIDKCRREIPHLVGALRSLKGTGATEMGFKSTQRGCPLDLRADELSRRASEVLHRLGPGLISQVVMEPSQEYVTWINGGRVTCSMTGLARALDCKKVHAALADLVGLHPKKVERPAPCLFCRKPSLYSWVGEDEVRCGTCEWSISLDNYEIYCAELVKESRRG